jgi:ABC-type nitrate/sulfonate/bicarbonate transport system substrate-binding protein
MHKVATIVILISIALAGLIYIGKKTKTEQEIPLVYSGPKDSITIANIGEFSIFNIIAEDQNYFSDYGLDAKILEYPSGPAAIKDLLDGKVDVAIAADFVGVNNIFNNKDLRILSQVSKHETFFLLARSDKNLTNPLDLIGKKVGVTKKGAGEFFLGRFLTLNNINMSDITIVDLPPADLSAQLENGGIDAIVIFDPHAYNLRQKLGDKILSWPIQGNLKTLAVLYSTQKYLDGHNDVVKRYVSALTKAQKFNQEHTEDTKVILQHKLAYDKKYIDYMWPHFEFGLGLDQELLLNLEDEARWVISNKLTTATSVPNYLDFIYFGALQEVKADEVSIIH